MTASRLSRREISPILLISPYGRISSITCGGKELLSAPVEPQIWRAPCYNRGSSEMWRLKNFRYAAQKTYSCLVCETDGGVCIKTKIAIGGLSCPPVIHADVDYKFTPDGCVTLCFDGDVIENARYCRKSATDSSCLQKMKASAISASSREKLMSTDTSLSVSDSGTQRRRIILSIISARRRTARITAPVLPRFIQTRRDSRFEPFGMEHFSFNAQHFTAQMLEDTKHDFELKPLEDTVVSLDWRMTGNQRGGVSQRP